MQAKLPTQLKTYLGWKFDAVLPGSFRRNKEDFAHLDYPILSPLPTAGAATPTIERSSQLGPYVYFVCDADGNVRYVGKSKEKYITQRWIRPGVGGPSSHFWTHSIGSGGCVFNIAQGLQSGESRFFTLHYVPVAEIGDELRQSLGVPEGNDLASIATSLEKALIRNLCPDWNGPKSMARQKEM